MKNPVVLAMFAYFLFAAQSVILEMKLSRFTPGATLVVLYLTTLPLVLMRFAELKLSGGPIIWPTGLAIFWVAAAGSCYFFGDMVLIKAYTTAFEEKVPYLNAIVLVAVLFPIFAVGIKYGWTRANLPNRYHMAAFAMAAGMLYLVYKGQQMQDEAAAAATPLAP